MPNTPATVEFFGETFELAGDFPEFEYLEFCEAASSEIDADAFEGFAVQMRLVMAGLAESERKRFRITARAKRAKTDDLLPVLQAVVGLMTDRPTGRSSDSSDGPSSIPETSGSSSDGKVSPLHGRPDKALAVQRSTGQALSA